MLVASNWASTRPDLALLWQAVPAGGEGWLPLVILLLLLFILLLFLLLLLLLQLLFRQSKIIPRVFIGRIQP